MRNTPDKSVIGAHKYLNTNKCFPKGRHIVGAGVNASTQISNDLSLRCLAYYNVKRHATVVTLDILTGTVVMNEDMVCGMTIR